jgi:RNA polymerase sigma-70 factor (ECF subfamily)
MPPAAGAPDGLNKDPQHECGANFMATHMVMVSSNAPSLGLLVSTEEETIPPYVSRARAGDARAFQELYRNHRRDVARLVARLLGPRPDAEDVIQEVFIQVFRSLVTFRGDSRFTTWLHRVTVNVTLMHLRAARSRPQLGAESAVEPLAPDELSPHEGAARNERMRALYKILDTLSEKKRAVFILHDLEGTPANQISTTLDIPVLTVRTRLFYARKEVYAAMMGDPTLEPVARELQGAMASGGDAQ